MSQEKGIEPSAERLFKELGQKSKFSRSCAESFDRYYGKFERVENQGKLLFLENGGKNFTYIKCLNDSKVWIEVLYKWIEGWKSKEN